MWVFKLLFFLNHFEILTGSSLTWYSILIGWEGPNKISITVCGMCARYKWILIFKNMFLYFIALTIKHLFGFTWFSVKLLMCSRSGCFKSGDSLNTSVSWGAGNCNKTWKLWGWVLWQHLINTSHTFFWRQTCKWYTLLKRVSQCLHIYPKIKIHHLL